ARFLLDAFERLRFARIHCKRFLAKNMLSGAQQRAGLFEVNVVWRADMNAGDLFVGGEFSKAGVGFFQAERFCGGASAFRGAEHATFDGNSQAAERFEVRPADKTETDDGDGMFHESGSPRANLRAQRSGILRRETKNRHANNAALTHHANCRRYFSASRPARTFCSSFFTSVSASGKRRFSPSSVSMMAEATTSRVYHLLSAGTTYHGACL